MLIRPSLPLESSLAVHPGLCISRENVKCNAVYVECVPQSPKRQRETNKPPKSANVSIQNFVVCGYLIVISFISYRPRGESRLVR